MGKHPSIFVTHPITGEQWSFGQIARNQDLPYDTIRNRHMIGWSLEELFGLTKRVRPTPTRKPIPKSEELEDRFQEYDPGEEMRRRAAALLK